jgi:hypothetical protein
VNSITVIENPAFFRKKESTSISSSLDGEFYLNLSGIPVKKKFGKKDRSKC